MLLKRLFALYGTDANALAKRFRFLAWQGPGKRAGLVDEVKALDTYLSAHGKRLKNDGALAAFRRLRNGRQAVLSPDFDRPVHCKATLDHSPTRAVEPDDSHGASMTIPKPIAALLATLAAAAAPPVLSTPIGGWFSQETRKAEQPIPTKVVSLGPHRFRLPLNLFNGQDGYNLDGTDLWLALSGPDLEAIPMGVNFHDDMTMFISTIHIHVGHVDRLDDAQYARLLQSDIEPLTADTVLRENPASNLHMRIKGEAMFGLTPYYLDFERLKSYYVKAYGPDTPAIRDMEHHNDDWLLNTDSSGVLRSIVKCTSFNAPDGARLEEGRIVDAPVNRRRSTCNHMFLLPEFKATVEVNYLRILLPEWKRIEERITTILRNAKVEK